MTGHQAKAARELLGLPRDRLAFLADIPVSALGHFEQTGRMPSAQHWKGPGRLETLRHALLGQGVEFTNGEEHLRATLGAAGVEFVSGGDEHDIRLRVASTP